MSIGERIRQARKKKNLTQKQLAEMIDAKHNSISGWEKDLHKPDIDSIARMAEILDVNPLWLLNRDDLSSETVEIEKQNTSKQKTILSGYLSNNEISKEVEEVITAYLKLSVDNKNMVRKMLDLPPLDKAETGKNKKQQSETSQHIA